MVSWSSKNNAHLKVSLERSRAQRVESVTLASVHDGKLTSHCEHSTLASSVCQLWGGRAHERDYRRSVDDGAVGFLVLAEGLNSMLATEPHALDVNVLRQVPDLLRSINGICVIHEHAY